MAEMELTFKDLEERRKREEDDILAVSSDLSLRMRRAISWGMRAEDVDIGNDPDLAFICYWVAFNSAYAEEQENSETYERNAFRGYLQKVVNLDSDLTIFNEIQGRFHGPVNTLVKNKFVYEPFWKNHLGHGEEDWRARFDSERQVVSKVRWNDNDVSSILMILFDRLYVLRNQLFHGGATWGSSRNRRQVEDGARIMAFLCPLFIALMLDNPSVDWKTPRYPVVQE